MLLVFRFTVRAWSFFPSAAVLMNNTESFIFSHPPSCHIWKTSIAHIWQTVCEHLIQIIMRHCQILAHAMCLLMYYSQWLSDEGIYPAPLPTFPTPFTGEDAKRGGKKNLWNVIQNWRYNLAFEPACSASEAHVFSIIPQSIFLKVKKATLVSSFWSN